MFFVLINYFYELKDGFIEGRGEREGRERVSEE